MIDNERDTWLAKCKNKVNHSFLRGIAVNRNNFVTLVKVPFNHKETDRLLPKTSAVVRAPLSRVYLMRTGGDHIDLAVRKVP